MDARPVEGLGPQRYLGASEEFFVKKGRHRRFVEARELKRNTGPRAHTCDECGAAPEDIHAEWCLADEDAFEEILGSLPRVSSGEEDPLAAEG